MAGTKGPSLGQYAPGVSQGYARITALSGESSFFAYAVINDESSPRQRSDDGAFVPMQVED
ncbi:MAG: hypothetical protein U0V70_16610 [Terriglobia bacterium]